MKVVGDYVVQFATLPEHPTPKINTLLQVSFQDRSYGDLGGVETSLTILRNNRIVHFVPAQRVAFGDIGFDYTFEEPGIYVSVLDVTYPSKMKIEFEFEVYEPSRVFLTEGLVLTAIPILILTIGVLFTYMLMKKVWPSRSRPVSN